MIQQAADDQRFPLFHLHAADTSPHPETRDSEAGGQALHARINLTDLRKHPEINGVRPGERGDEIQAHPKRLKLNGDGLHT